MEICIHRGTHEIGGTCVEIAHDSFRIAVDLGLPLDAEANGPELLPAVAGITHPAEDFLGIIISHPHQDHYGLLAHVPENLPIAMGQASRRILETASRFMPGPKSHLGNLELKDRQTLALGPFTITPFTVDHSAYDAYALLIEAGGRRVFYSGDFRAHGRKAALFEKLIAAPPTPIDCLMLEGTSLARLDEDAHFITESELEKQFVDAFKRIAGLAMVFASGQNIDRLVTIYRAAINSGRCLILDLYTAEILAATENERLPQGHWKDIHVIIPRSQSKQADETENLYKRHNCINWKKLHELAPKAVMLCRATMLKQLASTGNLAGAEVIYSMWDGYLKDGKQQAQLDALNKPKFAEVVGSFVDFISGAELIIHNAPFDVGFLSKELELAGLPALGDHCPNIIDTLKLAKNLHPGKKNNLNALCDRYQIDTSQRAMHSALLDTELLAEVYLAMTKDAEPPERQMLTPQQVDELNQLFGLPDAEAL